MKKSQKRSYQYKRAKAYQRKGIHKGCPCSPDYIKVDEKAK